MIFEKCIEESLEGYPLKMKIVAVLLGGKILVDFSFTLYLCFLNFSY